MPDENEDSPLACDVVERPPRVPSSVPSRLPSSKPSRVPSSVPSRKRGEKGIAPFALLRLNYNWHTTTLKNCFFSSRFVTTNSKLEH